MELFNCCIQVGRDSKLGRVRQPNFPDLVTKHFDASVSTYLMGLLLKRNAQSTRFVFGKSQGGASPKYLPFQKGRMCWTLFKFGPLQIPAEHATIVVKVQARICNGHFRLLNNLMFQKNATCRLNLLLGQFCETPVRHWMSQLRSGIAERVEGGRAWCRRGGGRTSSPRAIPTSLPTSPSPRSRPACSSYSSATRVTPAGVEPPAAIA